MAFTVSGCCLKAPVGFGTIAEHVHSVGSASGHTCDVASLPPGPLASGQVSHSLPLGTNDFIQDLVSFELVFKKGSTSILIKVYNIQKELGKLLFSGAYLGKRT